MSRPELEKLIADVQKKMKKAAAELNFEAAAELRDQMVDLKSCWRIWTERLNKNAFECYFYRVRKKWKKQRKYFQRRTVSESGVRTSTI